MKSPRLKQQLWPSLVPTLTLLTMLLAACEAPRGSTGGRVDPYRSTSSDIGSTKASLPELLTFCDRAAQGLAQDLTTVPEIRDSPERVVVALGSIKNLTRTPTSDFDMMQARLRGQLFDSDVVRKHVKFIEDPHRMDRELDRLEATGAPGGQTARYPVDALYLLQGDFHESERGGRRQYYFEFKLVSLADSEIVLNERYDLGQFTP